MDINVSFCCALLRGAREDFKKLLPSRALKGLYVMGSQLGANKHYNGHVPRNEFFPNGFYWEGNADNAYDAKASTIFAIINRIENKRFDDEQYPIKMEGK